MGLAISLNDPLRINKPPIAYQVPNNNIGARTPYSPQTLLGAGTRVIITYGQSLAANYSGGAYTPTSPQIYNLNMVDGGIYTATSVLLGCDGVLTNFATELADQLISGGNATKVIIASIAAGGSAISEWNYAGVFNQRISIIARRLIAAGLTPNWVLQQQGTTDNSLNTSQADYMASNQQAIDTFRNYGINCPILIAKESWVSGDLDTNVRAAQAAMVNNGAGVYAGPDTDVITERRDAAHFNNTGRTQQATAWRAAILALP